VTITGQTAEVKLAVAALGRGNPLTALADVVGKQFCGATNITVEVGRGAYLQLVGMPAVRRLLPDNPTVLSFLQTVAFCTSAETVNLVPGDRVVIRDSSPVTGTTQ
jgi:hypothetical protein